MAFLASCTVMFALALAVTSPVGQADDVPSCASTDATCRSEAAHAQVTGEAQLEDREATEAALLEVRLLQSSVRVAPKAPLEPSEAAAAAVDADKAATAAVNADKVAANQNATGEDAIAGSYDHNGHLCMLCGKPLPGRVAEGKTYESFRMDCGGRSSPSGPGLADLTKPVVEFAQATGGHRNGFCELNFAKSCVDAAANKDYLYWAKSIDLKHADMRENAKWDGHYCKMNGFLSRNVSLLQHDFAGMRAKAAELCETKYKDHGIEKMAFKDILKEKTGAIPTIQEAEKLAAWNCAMGDLGCDMAMCAYSFCVVSDGEGVGLYEECEGWHPVYGMPVSKE